MARRKSRYKVGERVEFIFLSEIQYGVIIEEKKGVHKIKSDRGTVYPNMKTTKPVKTVYGYILGPEKVG